MNESYFTLHQVPLLWHSTIGIERESLRVDPSGEISALPHASEWGTRNHQPYIQTDFAESQLELITPPEYKEEAILHWLAATHQIVATTNDKNGELLWPFSTPAVVPSDTTDIKIAQLSNPKEFAYRNHLAELYGKHVQLISGIHYNFQLNAQAIEASFRDQSEFTDLTAYNNEVYMHLGRNYFRYRWFLTYFLGASPYVASNYNTNFYGKPHAPRMRSVRQSHYGYQNKKTVVMDYSTLDSFVDSLEDAVEKGDLSLEKELYRDVRFRGGQRVRELIDTGITYLEFRNIDINPFVPYGIDTQTIQWIHLFLIALLFLDDLHTDSEVVKGNNMNYAIAEADALTPCPYMDEAHSILEVMHQVYAQLEPTPLLDEMFSLVEASLSEPELTLAGRIVQAAPDYEDFLPLGIQLAQDHQAHYLENPYQLHGFEHLELSTQDVVKEAIKIGIQVQVMDHQDNILRLRYGNHEEYVRNANMTSLDSLISYYLMENKITTKAILEQAEIQTPRGIQVQSIQDAQLVYDNLPQQGIVIKPNATNYGIGITIFEKIPSYEDYIEAVQVALNEDSTVLIEEYVTGTELRFYVQDGQTLGVVERQPAQVTGDGVSTIQSLIDRENQNPLRGVKHMAPLTTLELGDIETLQLKAQGYTSQSVVPEGETVFLRKNSNVSTGGISIDRTDSTHVSYHQIAAEAAQALGAYFCGVDIIIDDYTQPARNEDADNPANYRIIEANFNPNITIHRFPGQGKPRLLGRAVLTALFPEAYPEG